MSANKDNLLINKYIAALLGSVLLIMLLVGLSGLVYHTEELAEPAYAIAAPGAEPAVAVEEAQEDAGPEPVGPLLAAADAERGASLSKRCVACHSMEEGGRAKTGPNLYDIIGRAKAGSPDFGGYSAAMKDAGGEWSYEELNIFLAGPKKYIQGTSMNFAGLKSAEDRADLIAYLRSLSNSPRPLP